MFWISNWLAAIHANSPSLTCIVLFWVDHSHNHPKLPCLSKPVAIYTSYLAHYIKFWHSTKCRKCRMKLNDGNITSSSYLMNKNFVIWVITYQLHCQMVSFRFCSVDSILILPHRSEHIALPMDLSSCVLICIEQVLLVYLN